MTGIKHNNKKLAIHGGTPLITKSFKSYNSIGREELTAATNVIKSGVLSAYTGTNSKTFMGGEKVKAFESHAAKYFGVKHAIAVNSWTSGLIAAVGAIGTEPGDEIITTSWTMSATAMAILHWNAIPVFADINPDTFNICPKSVERLITSKTKCIIAADIFGQSCDIKELKKIARQYNLKLICDTAQAPASLVGNKFTGTMADIGGFSLNFHKHIHCGEGGILVTNNTKLAKRLCLIRNHAESVIDSSKDEDLVNLIGFNFRLGEIEAAIATEQLKKLNSKIISRQKIANQLTEGLSNFKGLKTPFVPKNSTHVYYVYGITLDLEILNVSRQKIMDALAAEGVPGLMTGYQNIHLLPIFQKKIAYGTNHFPWKIAKSINKTNYSYGICPVAEKLHHETFLGLSICLHELPHQDVSKIILAFKKVWDNLDDL